MEKPYNPLDGFSLLAPEVVKALPKLVRHMGQKVFRDGRVDLLFDNPAGGLRRYQPAHAELLGKLPDPTSRRIVKAA